MFLRLKPLLSSKMMRNGSSMGGPPLPENVICVFLCIGEILNKIDTEGLHVKKDSSLSNQMAACLQPPGVWMPFVHGL